MTDTPSSSSPVSSPDHPAPSRNPVERLLVRGGIVLLLLVVVVEYRAKKNYDASVSGLQELTDRNADPLMTEAQERMVGFSRVEGPTKDGQGFETYSYSWFSLFRSGTYRISLTAAGDNKTLRTFGGPAFEEDPAVVAARKAESNADIPGAAPPVIGAAPGTGAPPSGAESDGDSEQSPAPESAPTDETPASSDSATPESSSSTTQGAPVQPEL